MVYYFLLPTKSEETFEGENAKLISLIKERLPKKIFDRVLVSTDDEKIKNIFRDTAVKLVHRPEHLKEGNFSKKEVIKDVTNKMHFHKSDDIVLLCPEYAKRQYEDIVEILHWYQQQMARTLLCSHDPVTDPNRLVKPVQSAGYRAEKALESDVNKNIEYKEVSHFMCIFSLGELDNLNDDFYSNDTIYYPLNYRPLKVNSKEEWESYEKNNSTI